VTRTESVPADLPIEDIRVDIALDWSPAQALAAYEWLEVLRSRIWLLYGDDIMRLLCATTLRQRLRPPAATTTCRSELRPATVASATPGLTSASRSRRHLSADLQRR